MPRIARIVAIDYPHHIIQRGNNRQPVFFDTTDRELYLGLLRKYAKGSGCKIKAYCLMDNHIHLLLVPQHTNSLAKTMQKLSLSYTQYINKKYERTGRLWECRFFSSLVDVDTYLWSVCRYIERNPVRARLVDGPIKYKWSSAKFNTSLGHKDNFIEPIWNDYLNREDYVEFLNRPETESEISRIRQSTLKGIPIGREEFIREITRKLGFSINTRPKGRPRKEK